MQQIVYWYMPHNACLTHWIVLFSLLTFSTRLKLVLSFPWILKKFLYPRIRPKARCFIRRSYDLVLWYISSYDPLRIVYLLSASLVSHHKLAILFSFNNSSLALYCTLAETNVEQTREVGTCFMIHGKEEIMQHKYNVNNSICSKNVIEIEAFCFFGDMRINKTFFSTWHWSNITNSFHCVRMNSA